MSNYVHHSLALTEEEEKKLEIVKKSSGFGVKKIFMAMVEAMLPTETRHESSINHIQAEED